MQTVRDNLRAAKVHQAAQANKKRAPDLPYDTEGRLVDTQTASPDAMEEGLQAHLGVTIPAQVSTWGHCSVIKW